MDNVIHSLDSYHDLCVVQPCANLDCSNEIIIVNKEEYQVYHLYSGCCSHACYDWVHSVDIDLLCDELCNV